MLHQLPDRSVAQSHNYSFIPFHIGTLAWQIYNLSRNPGEPDDIAEKERKVL